MHVVSSVVFVVVNQLIERDLLAAPLRRRGLLFALIETVACNRSPSSSGFMRRFAPDG